MVTIKVEELGEKSGMIESYLEAGERVVVTKNGEPIFDAVPSRKGGMQEYAARIREIWKGCEIRRTTDEMIAGLRESRE